MSDSDEYEYEYGSDDQYGSEEDQEEQDDELIEIENTFYEADDIRQSEPQRAADMFARVVELESARGDEVKWRFKALEHLVVLLFRLDRFEESATRYRELLACMGSVTRNESSDSINTILDTVSSSTQWGSLQAMYEITLTALKDANNERLWFNTNVKLGKCYLESGDTAKLNRIIAELHKSCQNPDGTDDTSQGTYLLEVYALEIQLCRVTKDSARMRDVYPKTQNLDAAIADPRILGVIRCEGGKMFMTESRWTDAYNELFEAFRNYQESGNAAAKDCLKLVVLSNMLASSDINPFDSQEAKVYQDNKEIQAMVNLRLAYSANDITQFESILRDPRNHIVDDPFIMSFVEPLLRNIRAQVLLARVRPYKRIRLDFLAGELNVSPEDVESLVVELILDSRLSAKVDQTNGVVVLGGAQTTVASAKYDAIDRWAGVLGSLHGHVTARLTA